MADTVKKEEDILQKPTFESQWQDSLNQAMDKILNREKFSYDLNGDALYQQYKNQYMTQGKQAMMDTMGVASAMTGGYGNSYAQTAGQQTYQGYLQGLNDKVPELYQMARNAYDSDTDELYKQYALYSDRDDVDYGRYRDEVGDYQWDTEFNEAIKRFLTTATPEQRTYYETYGKIPEEGEGTTSSGNKVLDWLNSIGANVKTGSSSGSSSTGSKGSASLSEVVQQVIRGDWGNGADRKKALEAAGYDYATVQAAVNKAMDGVKVEDTVPVQGPEVTGTEGVLDMDDVKTVKAAMMTRTEFARHNGGASTDGVTYKSYNDYVKAVLDQYMMGDGISERTYAYLAAYYGLK